jgi:hypothetical protein
MYEGEEYEKLKQKAKKENFVYDLTSKRHDVETLHKLVSDALSQADLNETRFCINTKQKKGEIDNWFFANNTAIEHIRKAFYSLENDIRRLNK